MDSPFLPSQRGAIRIPPSFGLATIGLGFISMNLGSIAAQPGWLTMLLVEGIATALQRAAPKDFELAQLRVVAEAIAAGNAESLATGQAIIGNLPEAVVQHGLIAGFGLVMILAVPEP